MGLIQEYKDFINRGNVLDLAVGVVIGAAFGKIINSLVQDIIMPPIGMMLGGVDFKNMKYVLKEAQGDIPAVSINYGAFINTLIEFFIVAFVIFLVVRAYNNMKKKEETAPAPPPASEVLLTEIRDLLKK
ncbi:MAG: large-conductance mechanosensitive channel protein MscL [Chitinophagales bacterium]|nr:large-conductance mechanosensitive channel protein MscL [Bacteroidota bacterium]MCB9042731.1 large-conductance mechanosensitive channel protein MscL [Chitinophagales bacterium]